MKNNNQPEIAEPIVIKCAETANVSQSVSIDDKGVSIGPLIQGNQSITARLSILAYEALCKELQTNI
jgi:hypothetical protein